MAITNPRIIMRSIPSFCPMFFLVVVAAGAAEVVCEVVEVVFVFVLKLDMRLELKELDAEVRPPVELQVVPVLVLLASLMTTVVAEVKTTNVVPPITVVSPLTEKLGLMGTVVGPVRINSVVPLKIVKEPEI